ncbi:MAG: hypothetical protein KBD51_03815 [Candidatus Levybacteria bacterium]|nr:hypothetical protein [Candidatus Levybacteria bacterium]
MKNDLKIKKIIKQAIDIHYHVGPEIVPRKFNAPELINSEKGKIGGLVLKNHFFPTSPFIKETNPKGIKLFGGLALNNFVGGLNPETIISLREFDKNPIIVWFPTINSKNFLKKSKFEIAPEWVNDQEFNGRLSINVKPVTVFKDNKLTINTIFFLRLMRDLNLTLATGHLSWQESKILSTQFLNLGGKVVLTHPIYQKINMPIKIQKELADKGCFIEQSYSMYSIDKIPIEKIAQQIKSVGCQSVILSSDVGQKFSPPPSYALYKFCSILLENGINYDELYLMLVLNPKKLLGIV